MIRKLTLLATALATVGACAGTSVQSTGGDIATTTPVNARRITAGTMIDVKTNTRIGSKQNNVGDTFLATVSDAVVAQNGQTVIPEGATVYGHITGLQNAPKAGEASVIRVDFNQIAINGQTYPLEAKVTEVKPPSMSSETLKKAGIGAAAGAALGAILSGGDLDKLLIGGALGAAAGTVISLGTDREPELPSGTRLKLQAIQSVGLR